MKDLKEYQTVEEAEYDGSWVEGICTGDIQNCPHLFICLCEEEEYDEKKKLKNSRYKNIRNKITEFADGSTEIFTDDMKDEEIKEVCLKKTSWY